MPQKNDLQDLVGSKLTIPTLPEVVLRVQHLVEDPNSGTSEIGAVISEDAPLAAKVLRVANSAYYGLAGRCTSIELASTVLGVHVLRSIVAQVSVLQAFKHVDKKWGAPVKELWSHATQTAQICSRIAEKAPGSTSASAGDAYTCGLLHDIGKVVMLDGLEDAYVEAIDAARKSGEPLHEIERERFGFDHAEVGGVVGVRWDLPETVVSAIERHHGPQELALQQPISAAVYAANQIAHHAASGDEASLRSVFDEATSKALGLDQAGVDSIVEAVLDTDAEPSDERWHDDPW